MKSKVLIIDDEPGMLRAVERILSGDHEIATASSPLDAIALAQRLEPDLVICDVSMPKMDGFEVMSRLKQQLPGLDVILMTGLSEPDGHLVRALREGAFYFVAKPFHRDVMRTLVDRCLELRQLRQAQLRHAHRMERELAEARTFQHTMLPPPQATIEGIDIAARYLACTELCGDLYDYAAAGAGKAAVLVADVSGHGVSASMLTSVIKSAFASSAADGYAPAAVISRARDEMRSFNDSRFVTLIAAVIDRDAGQVCFANAGHPAGLLARRDGTVQKLEATGSIISPAFADETWPEETVAISPGDQLFLLTDGLTDTFGDSGIFGQQRVVERARAAVMENHQDIKASIDAVLQACRDHANGRPQSDDLTLLVARLGN
jgi:sigma-B regulation protein RsbU (phosphoserine phosphatase)